MLLAPSPKAVLKSRVGEDHVDNSTMSYTYTTALQRLSGKGLLKILPAMSYPARRTRKWMSPDPMLGDSETA